MFIFVAVLGEVRNSSKEMGTLRCIIIFVQGPPRRSLSRGGIGSHHLHAVCRETQRRFIDMFSLESGFTYHERGSHYCDTHRLWQDACNPRRIAEGNSLCWLTCCCICTDSNVKSHALHLEHKHQYERLAISGNRRNVLWNYHWANHSTNRLK